MSTIVQIPRVKGDVFKAIVRIKGIKPYSRTFQIRKAAEHWLAAEKETVDLVSAGVDIEVVRMTFTELCDEYLEKGWKGKDGGRAYHVAWWREQLGKHSAQKLTKQQVKAALREYRAGAAR